VTPLLTPADRERLLAEYFADEWGTPRTTERDLFETLSLCGFQAGLSWETVLVRRPRLREAFSAFDLDRVAAYDTDDAARLLAHPGMIRNRRKISAVIVNARASIALRDEGTTLAERIWAYRPERTVPPASWSDLPRSTPESTALAAELKRRGFVFVGPTILFAVMATCGVVDVRPTGSTGLAPAGPPHPRGSRAQDEASLGGATGAAR